MSLDGQRMTSVREPACVCITKSIVYDCAIIECEKIEDHGITGTHLLVLNFNNLPPGRYFLKGQQYPNGPWIEYPFIENLTEDYGPYIGNCQAVAIEWPNGELFEFTFGIELTEGGDEVFIDPSCSAYRYPMDAPVGEQHLAVRLGEKKVCEYDSTGDSLVKHIEPLENNQYRVYLDFSSMNLVGCQNFFVSGQSAPDSTWIDYQVNQEFPCFSFTITWSGGPFEFSYGIID